MEGAPHLEAPREEMRGGARRRRRVGERAEKVGRVAREARVRGDLAGRALARERALDQPPPRRLVAVIEDVVDDRFVSARSVAVPPLRPGTRASPCSAS